MIQIFCYCFDMNYDYCLFFYCTFLELWKIVMIVNKKKFFKQYTELNNTNKLMDKTLTI